MEEREKRIKEIKKMIKSIKHHCYVITQDMVFEESFADSSIQYIHDMLGNIEKQLDVYQQKHQQACKKSLDLILPDNVDVDPDQVDFNRSIEL